MNAGELDYCTTQDLINEILCRATFQGVIVHTVDEAKNRHWDGERVFAVRHSASLDTEEAGRLLDVISHHIASCDL